MSPPTVRFNIDTATITANPFGFSPGTRKNSPPLSSRTSKHSNLGQQQNSKLVLDTSPMKSRQTDFDGKNFFDSLEIYIFIYFLRFT